MPQFNFANFIPQLAWLAIFFSILYFGIVKATLPKITRVVDERDGKVSGDIAAAETAKAELDRIHQAYEAEMASAHGGAHDTIVKAKAQATRDAEARLAEANHALEAKAAIAAASLDAARTAAMGEIERVATEAAVDIVDRLSGVRPDDDSTRAAVRTAIAA